MSTRYVGPRIIISAVTVTAASRGYDLRSNGQWRTQNSTEVDARRNRETNRSSVASKKQLTLYAEFYYLLT